MIIFRSKFAVAFALAAASCSKSSSPDEWICENPPGAIKTSLTAVDQRNVVNQCILKWSYRLGRSQGANAEIAKAVGVACRGAVEEFSSQFLQDAGDILTTAQLDQLDNEIAGFEDEALYRVIQGRAGNCSVRSEESK